jgi:hypothetical protein
MHGLGTYTGMQQVAAVAARRQARIDQRIGMGLMI